MCVYLCSTYLVYIYSTYLYCICIVSWYIYCRFLPMLCVRVLHVYTFMTSFRVYACMRWLIYAHAYMCWCTCTCVHVNVRVHVIMDVRTTPWHVFNSVCMRWCTLVPTYMDAHPAYGENTHIALYARILRYLYAYMSRQYVDELPVGFVRRISVCHVQVCVCVCTCVYASVRECKNVCVQTSLCART